MDTNLPPLMPDEDKNFRGSLVLDFKMMTSRENDLLENVHSRAQNTPALQATKYPLAFFVKCQKICHSYCMIRRFCDQASWTVTQFVCSLFGSVP